MKVRDLDILPVYIYIVKPVLRGHIWDKKKSGLLRQVTS